MSVLPCASKAIGLRKLNVMTKSTNKFQDVLEKDLENLPVPGSAPRRWISSAWGPIELPGLSSPSQGKNHSSPCQGKEPNSPLDSKDAQGARDNATWHMLADSERVHCPFAVQIDPRSL